MSNGNTRTYQARIHITPEQEEMLAAYSRLYGRVERSLFASVKAGGSFGKLKPVFMRMFGITARQYNAVAAGLRGKVRAIEELMPLQISDLKTKIRTAEKAIVKAKSPEKKHYKKRRLENLRTRLAQMEAVNESGGVKLCFGGRKLFRSQFYLEENDYASHDDWKHDWEAARSKQFFVIGSKDETGGCQGCVAVLQQEGTFTLRLRLPDTLKGVDKYIRIPGVYFTYGQDIIEQALILRRAVSYRFKRDEKGWRVFVSADMPDIPVISRRDMGAMGVDINAGCLAVSETDRFGNLVNSWTIPLVTYGKTSEQAMAVIGDAVKQVIGIAVNACKPIVIEMLDFSEKKAGLEKENPRSSRMISGLAYSRIITTITVRAYDSGIEVIVKNPAYTSTIGAVNFARRYGISVHQGAALAIARRGFGFSEEPATANGVIVAPAVNGGHVAFPLPVRNRGKHVWSFWSAIRLKLEAAHAAHARSGTPGPLPLAALSSTWALPENSRHANRRQNCSAGVVDDVPWDICP